MTKQPFTVETSLEFIGRKPGCLTTDIAQEFQINPNRVISRLQGVIDRNASMGERVKFIAGPDGDPLTYRWYLPQDCPQETPVAPEGRKVSIQEILDFIGEHPGLFATEIAEQMGLPPGTNLGSRLTPVYDSKQNAGLTRLDRVEARAPGGRTSFRWYLPKDVPQEVLDERARIRAEAEAQLAALEAQRQANEQAAAEAAQAALDLAGSTPPAETDPVEAVAPTPEAAAAAARAYNASMAGVSTGDILVAAISDCVKGLVSVIDELFGDQLNAAIALRIEQAFHTVPERVRDHFYQVASKAVSTPSAPAPKEKLPKVVVVGLKPEQAHIIRTEYESQFELDFFPNDCSPGRLRDKLLYADHCLLMTTKISHSHNEVVKKSGKPYTFLNGIMTSLRNNLRALACTAS